jgi:hypothetical protein
MFTNVKGNIIDDRCITIDSEFGKKLDFTSNKFTKYSYLWIKDNYIYVSFIESVESNKGYFSNLIKKIRENGYGVKVPVPMSRMEMILKKKGFKFTFEEHELTKDVVEVYVLG